MKCSELNSTLKQRCSEFGNTNENWNIEKSTLSGCGVFARMNYQPGDLIFEDAPIVLGPRASLLPAACVTCMKTGVPLEACSNGCRLPVCCKECENSLSHKEECLLLKRYLVKEGEVWSPLLYRALTPFRCLLIKQREKKIIKLLSANRNNKNVEMLMLKKELQKKFTPQEESYLNHCCSVLSGTAFETEVGEGNAKVSLRGLYPLAGMMNHSCVPNTQRYFISKNDVQIMCVIAAVPIMKDEELTTNYCHLLWPTIIRRHFLSATKEFWCTCLRCKDPSEFGSYLSALECPCGGFIVPVCAINVKSDWKCESCNNIVPASKLPYANPLGDEKLTKYKVKYLQINDKVEQVWSLGHKNTPYRDLSTVELDYKENAARELLALNDKLKLGDSRFKGMILYELYETLNEKKKRNQDIKEAELHQILEPAKKILNITVE